MHVESTADRSSSFFAEYFDGDVRDRSEAANTVSHGACDPLESRSRSEQGRSGLGATTGPWTCYARIRCPTARVNFKWTVEIRSGVITLTAVGSSL